MSNSEPKHLQVYEYFEDRQVGEWGEIWLDKVHFSSGLLI
jgi:hypothetical protein